MSRDFHPVYSSTADGPDLTLCRILEAVSVIAPATQDGNVKPFSRVSVAGTNAEVVKASAGKVFNFIATNVHNQTRYVKFYDKATTPNPITDTADYILPIQNGQTIALALGVAPFVFHNGISIAMVSSASGGGNINAGDIVLSMSWI
jgi:hypothetical protein